MKKRLAVLGPAGTHSDAAAAHFNNLVGNVFAPVLYDEIGDALVAAIDESVDAAFVPVENSLEGAINVTLDFLAAADGLSVTHELVWSVKNVLAAKCPAKEVRQIYSHPQPVSQCRRFLRENFPNAEIIKVGSTAKAAATVAQEPREKYAAALCSRRAAALNGLSVLSENIEDSPNNCTRFFAVAGASAAKERSGESFAGDATDEKTLVICRIDGREAGSLLKVLEEFAALGVNLTRIESRPARTILGEYIFFFDVQSNTTAAVRERALNAVAQRSLWLKNVGTFPVLTA